MTPSRSSEPGLAPGGGGATLTYSESPEYHRTFAGRPRIEPLTGVRWFAALMVFFSHFSPSDDLSVYLRTFFASGYMGVTLFFVLSGFILTVTYSEALAQPSFRSVWNFGVARLARVYPAYLVVLLYVFATTASDGGSLANWPLHVLAVQTWSDSVYVAYSFNPPGWSIGVEFFLYACFPLLVYLLVPLFTSPRRCLGGGAFVAGLMGLAVLYFHLRGLDALSIADPHSAHRWLNRMPVLRLGDFVLGMASGSLYLKSRQRPPGAMLALIAQLTMVATIVALMCQPSLLDTAGSWDVIYAVPACILLYYLAVRPDAGVSVLLGLPVIVALGEASYAFYLIHWPLGEALGIGDNPKGWDVAAYVLRLAFLVMLAWGVHVALERPCRRWLRRHLSLT